MNTEAIISRIRQLLDWQQLSPTQFADRIGVGRPIISHILSERNKASLDVALRISTAFPEVSLEWLLKGAGQMLATDAAVPAPPLATVAVPPAVAVTIQAGTPTAPAVAGSSFADAPTARPQPSPRPAAARFQPGRPAAAASPPETIAATTPVAPTEQAAPAASLQSGPPSPTPAVAPSVSPVLPPARDTGQMLAGFAEPGKAIRRIVIFYRDGSFTDYQPEA